MRNSLVLAFALFTSLVQVQGQSVERINPRVQSCTSMGARIALPEQISLSYHKRLADSYAIEAILEGKTSQVWLKIPLHQIEGRNQISAHGLIKQLEIEVLKLTWQAEAPRELRLRQLRLTLEAKK